MVVLERIAYYFYLIGLYLAICASWCSSIPGVGVYLKTYFLSAAHIFYDVNLQTGFATEECLYTKFNSLSWAWDGIVAQLANILSWSTIWSYILSNVPNLTQLRDWFYSWVANVQGVVTSWWSATQVTVQSWITAATAGLSDLKVSWFNFSTSVLPTLVSLTWLTTWWNARLLDVQNLINTAFITRDSLWSGWNTWRDSVAEFFANPVNYIWERFINWFLGPEGG